MTKKPISVFGATGAQGGGLARAILADPDSGFAVRAVTRKPDSDAARALAAAGAEIVVADLDDAASVVRAMQGAYGAYCLTNFWEHFSPEKELAQAAIMAAAAAETGLQHVIWSTLEDTRRFFPVGSGRMPVLMGKYNVPHFDAKGEANQLFLDRGLPVTLLHTSFYWDNFIHFGMGPAAGPDGTLAITLPMGDAKLPGIAAADIGHCALGVFKADSTAFGTVGIAGEHLTGHEIAASFSHLLGRPVVYNAVTPEMYRGFGFPGADDLGNMFQFKRDFEAEFCGLRDVAASRRLNPTLMNFGQWLDANRAAFVQG
ncbi:MAG: NmrA/HSCARG family protein [Chromatiales bacterium]|nr:NmrA/HSCARG family protein [Chromatiales bacterium]